MAPGVKFAAWTYNGRVPGPTLRCSEGELLRVNFVSAGEHPHTIHFHGIHPSFHDGVPETAGRGALVQRGQRFTYEFDARPFGFTTTTATRSRLPPTSRRASTAPCCHFALFRSFDMPGRPQTTVPTTSSS